MEDINIPSPDVSVTQQSSGTPATGTPATESATPQKPTLSLEEAMKRIADLEHTHSNAREELDRHRKKLSVYEKTEKEAEAAKKAAEEAQLSEVERVKKQYSELQSQHDTYTRQMQERVVRYEIENQARGLNIIDPDAAVRLLDWSELEFAEDGTPTNAQKLLEKLVKSKPYLAPQTQTQQAVGTPQTAQPTPPARAATPLIPAMNPGRANIAAPNTTPPGKIPSLSEAYGKRRS